MTYRVSDNTIYINNDQYIFTGSEVRQWGQFFYIEDLQSFIKKNFSSMTINDNLPISPKILIINPQQRLSWQYHNRRKEIWSIIKGPVKMIYSDDNDEKYSKILNTNDIVVIENQERHRLVGLDKQAIVAELWCHTDVHLSDENDIIRLQDDYKRF